MNETVRIETVTPRLAQKWLQGNVDNRRLREARVLSYAKEMSDGEWDLSPDAITFDSNGTLLNGQHRLTAVVISGLTIRFLVLRGVPVKTQEVMDTGLSRNLADQLVRRQVPHANMVAGAVKWLYQFDYTEETGNVHFSDMSLKPSLRQLLAVYDQNTELAAQAPTINKLYYYLKVRTGPTLAAKHRLLRIDTEAAEVFFKHLQEGTGLSTRDPIWRLRAFCLADANTRTTTGRAPAYRYLALLFKAWNYWRDGNEIDRLNWVFSGNKREAWPTPR